MEREAHVGLLCLHAERIEKAKQMWVVGKVAHLEAQIDGAKLVRVECQGVPVARTSSPLRQAFSCAEDQGQGQGRRSCHGARRTSGAGMQRVLGY